MVTGLHVLILFLAIPAAAGIIAAVRGDPAPHAGRTYQRFGPVEMTHDEIAAEMARALNRLIGSP